MPATSTLNNWRVSEPCSWHHRRECASSRRQRAPRRLHVLRADRRPRRPEACRPARVPQTSRAICVDAVPSAVPVLPATDTPPRLAWPRHAKAGRVCDARTDDLRCLRFRMRGQFQSQPAIGDSQLERRDADAFHAEQSQLRRHRCSSVPESRRMLHVQASSPQGP